MGVDRGISDSPRQLVNQLQRDTACSTTETAAQFACQQLQLDAMGMQAPAAAGRESSAPRPYIGYISSHWHTRQPQPPRQLAAISWCRSHAYQAGGVHAAIPGHCQQLRSSSRASPPAHHTGGYPAVISPRQRLFSRNPRLRSRVRSRTMPPATTATKGRLTNARRPADPTKAASWQPTPNRRNRPNRHIAPGLCT